MSEELRKQVERLVFAIANDGKLNGISTPQKPWVDQILALLPTPTESEVSVE